MLILRPAVPTLRIQSTCPSCHATSERLKHWSHWIALISSESWSHRLHCRSTDISTAALLTYLQLCDRGRHCQQCVQPYTERNSMIRSPPFITLELTVTDTELYTMKVDRFVEYGGHVNSDTAVSSRWCLCGIVYLGHDHFVSRYICSEGKVWFHDGLATGRTCTNEGTFSSFGNSGLMTGPAATRACLFIYRLLH